MDNDEPQFEFRLYNGGAFALVHSNRPIGKVITDAFRSVRGVDCAKAAGRYTVEIRKGGLFSWDEVGAGVMREAEMLGLCYVSAGRPDQDRAAVKNEGEK